MKPNLYIRLLAATFALCGAALAQKAADPPPDPDKFIITANWRSRVEYWDWFSTPSFQDNYTFGASDNT